MPNYTLKTCTDICPWTPLKRRKDAASIMRKEILKFTSSMCTWTYKYLLGNIEGGVIKGKHKFVWMYFLNYNLLYTCDSDTNDAKLKCSCTYMYSCIILLNWKLLINFISKTIDPFVLLLKKNSMVTQYFLYHNDVKSP